MPQRPFSVGSGGEKLKLRPGVWPKEAADQVRWQMHPIEVGGEVRNANADYIVDRYISWASDTEMLISQLFLDPDLDGLYTTRFWNIRASTPSAPRLIETVWNECNRQTRQMTSVADELEGEAQRLRGDPHAIIVVVDTNVFLHCHSLESFDWSFVGALPVRVIVPIRVIEELDDKKRDRNPEIADRARKRIRWLRGVLSIGGDGSLALKGGATIEAFVPIGPRRLLPSADTEILEACETLETFARRPLTILTSDFGMELRGMHYRGASSGFPVVQVPEEYRLSGV